MTLSEAPSSISSTPADSAISDSWKINLLYDGDCPLCVREVNFLRKKDAERELVKFTDIADLNYHPEDNGGVDFETAMGRIHAVRADGSVVKNVAVFREVYDALGIGWMYAPTSWPIVGPVIDKVYDLWADKRLAMTGRDSLKAIMDERQTKIDCSDEGRCRVD